MPLIRSIALLTCALALAGAARAGAFARLDVAGQGVGLHVEMNGSGATQGEMLFPVTLDVGQTIDYVFAYTVTLSDQALEAERTWDFCTLIAFHSDCGPDPNGFEQAAASILFERDPRTDNPFISSSFIFDHFHSVPGTTRTFSGTIDYIATNRSDIEPQSTLKGVLAAVFVDANPVPEPPAVLSMMSGLLALLGFAGRLRSIGR
jgi:hypothetical protein